MPIPRPNPILSAGLMVLSLLPAAASARVHKLERLVVIGDSYSDGGNSGLLTQTAVPPSGFPPAPYVGGRLSNGPVAVEQLWRLYNPSGPALRPSQDGGSNHAVIGATTGSDNGLAVDPNPNTVPLRPFFAGTSGASQLSAALTTVDPDPNRSLYVVWLGGNDALYWFNSGGLATGLGSTSGTVAGGAPVAGVNLNTAIGNAVTNVLGSVAQLIAKGATNILVPNQIDFGKAPLYNTDSLLAPQITLIAQGFNAGLSNGLQALQLANPHVDIMEFDTFQWFNTVAANPSLYGLDNVANRCVQPSQTLDPDCDPNRWFFWDATHPTTTAHGLIAQAMFDRVYEVPGPLPLAGLFAAYQSARRLRRRLRR